MWREQLPATARGPRGRGGKSLVHTGSCPAYGLHAAFERLRGGEIVLAPERRARFLQRFLNAGDLGARLVKRLFGHLRGFGSHLTNVVRALALEASGYRVTVTELAGWEHAVKNELILAKKVRSSSPEAKQKLDALLAATGVRPKIVRAPVP